MSKKKKIPVRVIKTDKGYSVELFVPKKLLNVEGRVHPFKVGIWRELRHFGDNFKLAWAYRNAELKSLGYL